MLLGYLPGLAVGAVGTTGTNSDDPKLHWLFVPIGGPFILMGQVSSPSAVTFLAIDGAAQVAGAALFVIGWQWWRVPIVTAAASEALDLRITPWTPSHGEGVAIEGRF